MRTTMGGLPARLRSSCRKRRSHATVNEAARLLNATLLRGLFVFTHHCSFLLALYTGRRKDAILSLRWHQVNLETGTIYFEQGRRTEKCKGGIPIRHASCHI
jgi:integrase